MGIVSPRRKCDERLARPRKSSYLAVMSSRGTDRTERRGQIAGGGSYQTYAELRYEGNRVITGVAMTYGDTAEMPWGGFERFETGAFGDLSKSDIILNLQHCREKMLCRTGGGGLSIEDDPKELRIRAEIPKTQLGDEVLELVKTRVLRGLSIEFTPDDYTTEMRDARGKEPTEVRVIKEAQLQNIAIVDRPAYPAARLNPRSQSAMDETEIRALVEEALEKRGVGESQTTSVNVDVLTRGMKDMMAKSIEGAVSSRVDHMVKAAMKEREKEMAEEVKRQMDEMMAERDEAEMKKMAAEQEKMEADKRAEEEREASEKRIEEERAAMEVASEERAELLVMLNGLLPQDTEVRGKSNQELLVLAVGDEVKEAEKRSEDYLRAKVEGIVERRQLSVQNRAQGMMGTETRAAAPSSQGGTGAPIQRVDIMRLAAQRQNVASSMVSGVKE